MKKLLKVASVIAVANLVAFWIVYALVLTLPLPLPVPESGWWPVLFWAFVVLAAPASIVLDGVNTGAFYYVPLLVISSVLNCIIWGLCLGFPIHALSKRLLRYTAQPPSAVDGGIPLQPNSEHPCPAATDSHR
jgi:hypothetical protein